MGLGFIKSHKQKNVINVAKAGGDFSDINSAMDSITGNDSANRVTIQVAPGIYTIDNTITALVIKNFVSIIAVGSRSVIFIPQDPTKDMFLGGIFTYVTGIVFSGNTGSGYALKQESSGTTVVSHCVLRDTANGFYLNNALGSLEISELAINNPLGTTTSNAVKAVAGNITLDDIVFRESSVVTTGINLEGSDVKANLHNIVALSSNINRALHFDSCLVVGTTITLSYCVDGMVILGNNADIKIDTLKILYCQNDGFRIEDIGTNLRISMFATTVSQNVNLNFNILNASALTTGSGFTEVNKSYIVPNSLFYVYLLDVTQGDEALKIFGELHVGSPMRPAESVFGGGESHTLEHVYTFDGATTYVDKSSEAKSFTGSTFEFAGITAGNCVYIANDFPLTFEGIKLALDAAADLGTGKIIAEYWNGTWTEFNGCTSKSTPGFLKYAKNYFSQVGSHHVKFDPFIIEDWIKNDPVVPALNTDYYWMRFRVDSDIVSSPVIQQIKIHTNRTEINGDGTIESHSDARTYKKLVVDSVKPLEGNMQSASIYVDENVGVGLANNRFTAVGDLLGISFELPEDCDTSGPLIFVWKGKFLSAGTVNFTVKRKIVKPKDSYTNAEPVDSGESVTVTTGEIIIDAGDTREDFRVDIDISDAIPSRSPGFGDEIWIGLTYPTRGAGNFDYTKLSANYLSDFNGRHIRQ